MTTATRCDTAVDLADPRVHAEQDLGDYWTRLRRDEPVHWNPPVDDRPGFWVISRYGDVADGYRDSTTFTSASGNVLETLLRGGDSAAGQMLAVSDGPRHAQLRQAVLKAFTPRALDSVVESVTSATEQLLQRALERARDGGVVDFARDVAAEIPLTAICDLLDVPHADRETIHELTSAALASVDGAPTALDTWVAKNEILGYFAELMEQRRDRPGADVLSLLLGIAPGGRRLSVEEVLYNCYSLILGGDETTRLAIIGGVRALIDNPDQWAAFRSGTVSTKSAVEEVLRWTTPALHAGRLATRDTVVRGVPIRTGELVTLWNSSANFDDEVFDAPQHFRLDRTPNKHLTFAHGAHFCLGAYLARVEIRGVLLGLRTLFDRVEAAGPTRRIYSNFLSGLATLPVSLIPVTGGRP